jgi:hypothetical protein
MKRETEFLRSQIKESFAQCSMNDSNQCPLCGLRTASERSTQTHLRSDHKRNESEIAELLSKAKAGSLGCDPAAKSRRNVIKALFSTVQNSVDYLFINSRFICSTLLHRSIPQYALGLNGGFAGVTELCNLGRPPQNEPVWP